MLPVCCPLMNNHPSSFPSTGFCVWTKLCAKLWVKFIYCYSGHPTPWDEFGAESCFWAHVTSKSTQLLSRCSMNWSALTKMKSNLFLRKTCHILLNTFMQHQDLLLEITSPPHPSSLSHFTCQDLESYQEGILRQKSQERGGRAYEWSLSVKEQQGFRFRGNIIFSDSWFWYESQQTIFSLKFLIFLFNCPMSGSDCKGFQSCANPVLDLGKILWSRNISDFLVNTPFSMKLSSSLHIPVELWSAHTNTPMHTDNAQVLTQ